MLIEALTFSLIHMLQIGIEWQNGMNEQGIKLLGRSIHARIDDLVGLGRSEQAFDLLDRAREDGLRITV